MRPWVFVLVVAILVAALVTAIVIPLLAFVFKKIGHHGGPAEAALADCQTQLSCENGGTSVASQGVCSCICTRGFTGSSCTVPDATGCTTTDLVASNGTPTISNVTLGNAIPRLVAASETNFSVPLSGTDILARLNEAGLSCVAQNSLVTFNGQALSASSEDDGVLQPSAIAAEAPDSISVVTVLPGQSEVVTVAGKDAAHGSALSTIFATTVTISVTVHVRPTTTAGTQAATSPLSPTTTATPTPSKTQSQSSSAATLSVTDEVLDFARVAVLYVLEQHGLDDATTAQTALQRFFTTAMTSPGVSTGEASDVALGGGNSVNLVDLSVNVGSGPVGRRKTTRRSTWTWEPVAEVPRRRKRRSLWVSERA